ncbi:DUF1080 domain-containing protein [Kribbella sandramycini]|uniref:DUF1080 domain-containing protein n=1 Tax=Kribbella sandramycini TaxID=60450 RepID=A0A7Y4L8K7_9ACTN|nr:family 16 glycoside hydrolase [Kribbella sandramycini]MBB6570302.1 hypothetical protein [Kribbella sandramycini]NOL45166.1 DUF1080 domain-containing protein [Kribbella sandramycini]
MLLPSVRKRYRRPIAAAAAVLIALPGLVTGPARAALPPQEPGVTLRVFDLQAPLDRICKLKPGQTPNVDKLLPTINWSSTDDFGIADRFVSEVTANLNLAAAGRYEFRLTSDDGSRLLLDDELVINHDGLHGSDPAATASVELAAGSHPLRIEHFDNLHGQEIKLEWRTPNSETFVVVPTSVLSTDADVVRVTSPGQKECEASTDSPGDGLPLDSVYPGLTLTNLRPDGFEPQVTGMDWLPDGRLAITTWGGTDLVQGEVYLLSNVTGATDPGKVKFQRFATGLKEPQGIKYVDGKLYVSEKNRLVELNDANRDGVADTPRTVATWPYGGNFHEFAFGLLYEAGYFYLNLSVAINYGGATTDPQPAANRGTTIKIDKRTGAVTYLAGGLRTPNGIGWGPDGDIFVADNQGGWLPSNKIVRIKPGRFFNHYTNPAGPFDATPVIAPVVWLPHNEIANSPTNPILLKRGPFAGQLAYGDVTYGGIQRVFLDKVNGEYQGAVFRLTQGLESGVNHLSEGPDGALYTGGIGAGGNWGQEGKLKFGLQKLTPNSTSAFDIKAMRAVAGGFELEYTQPLSAGTLQELAKKYQVQQWRYHPTIGYGGPKIDNQTLRVTTATSSADGKKVTLRIDGLRAGHVVHVRSPRPFASASGTPLWSTEAWYTLNSLVGGQLPGQTYEAEKATLRNGAGVNKNHSGYYGPGFVDGYTTEGAETIFTVNAPKAATYNAGLRYSNGPNPPGLKSLSVYVNGVKVQQTRLASTGIWSAWATQTEPLRLKAGKNTISYRYDGLDTGKVNLDNLTITEATRIQLFDGRNLNAWQKGDGSPATWPIARGSMESLGGDIRTKQEFGDFKLHVEWLEPDYPPDVTGQRRGNSGVYLQERYEIQVLESFGQPPRNNEAGSIYSKKAPDVNAATAPNTWQSYDITFRAARFDAAGKVDNARVTVVWNGETVHRDVAIDGGTGGNIPEGPTPGAIRLQDHGDPGANPRFRNIWIEPIG